MRAVMIVAAGLACLAQMTGCASTVPPSRIAQYVGPPSMQAMATLESLPRPVHAVLVVTVDATASDAAPPPPEEALSRLAESLQQEFSRALPIVIDKVIPVEGIGPSGTPEPLQELGRKHGVRYVVFVVVSSTEQEYPLTIFLGWTTHSQPGWRRDNWSLMEAALVDETGQTLLRAEGRGWATLDRPTAPGINQWYPVVWLRPQDPARRFWPPTHEGAPNTLRVIAMKEAAKRLVLNFQEAWIEKRQAELDQARP